MSAFTYQKMKDYMPKAQNIKQNLPRNIKNKIHRN